MVLSSKIQGLNYGVLLLCLPKSIYYIYIAHTMAICTLHYIKTHNEKQVMIQLFGKKKCTRLT